MDDAKEKRSGIMRLYNIFFLCKSCLPRLKKVELKSEVNDKNICIVNNWGDCKEALDILKNLECFREKVEELYSVFDSYHIKLKTSQIPRDVNIIFRKILNEICGAVEVLVNMCDMMEMGQAESGIDIKIPKCESLKEYMSYLKDIDFIFTQCPYLLDDKEEVRFNNVDVGSQWLTFVVLGAAGTFYILNNLAKIIQKAIAIKSNIIVYRQQEEMLKEMQSKNEVAEETVQIFKKFKKTLLDESVSELEADVGKLQNGEERDKVKKTLEDMVILMDKGVEIYSSIETPKEIKVLFPFQKDAAILPDNILKMIEDKKENS